MIDDGLKILQGKEWTCWLIVKCSHSLVKALAAQRWSRSLSMFNAMVTKREITEWGCHVASTWANLCLNHSGTDSVSVKYNQVHPASNTLLGCWFMCSSLTQIIHGWKHCLLAVKAKCFFFFFCDMRRILIEQIRIQPGSLNPKATDKKKRKKERKIPISSSVKDDKDGAATLTSGSAAASPELQLGCSDGAETGRTEETGTEQPAHPWRAASPWHFGWLGALCWRHL